MKKTIKASMMLCISALSIDSVRLQAQGLDILWSMPNFKMPESVVYDAPQSRFYVSNVNGGPLIQDGNGSIGWISTSGKEVKIEWVKGLHSPKGMLLDYPYLYVTDVKELVVINVKSGVISARYEAKGSAVLNGITKTKNGQIYVSDWVGNAIYKLTTHELVNWLQSPSLQSPNGLFARNGYLYVSSWGDDIQDDFSTKTTGGLKRVKIADKTIESLTDGTEWMNLDGLHLLEDKRALTTDFIAGELLQIKPSGDIEQKYQLEPSAADFYFDSSKHLLIVPYLMGNKVTAYRLTQ